MPAEDFLFSAGGGFLSGIVAGYAIKKVMKIAAVIVGLFVAGLAYLSYRGWIDVKWTAMENATRSTLASVTTQAIHTQSSPYNRKLVIAGETNERPACKGCCRTWPSLIDGTDSRK